MKETIEQRISRIKITKLWKEKFIYQLNLVSFIIPICFSLVFYIDNDINHAIYWAILSLVIRQCQKLTKNK